MKKIVTIATLLFGFSCFSQSINDYTAVLIPLKYDFQKEQNQFRLQTLIKINLQNLGFQAFYSNEAIPSEITDRCKLLTLDLIEEKGFLMTKLFVVFRDCYGMEILKSEVGKSREKEFDEAYKEALNNAFKSIEKKTVSEATLPLGMVQNIVTIEKENNMFKNEEGNFLYARPTSNGYHLIDSNPKVVLKIYKTSSPSTFIAIKDTIQGILISKENNWFFECYQNEQLISEKVGVKF
jgi:hypothetical protein